MDTTKKVNALWEELRKVLKTTKALDAVAMREWNFTKFENMLRDQTTAEREHRRSVDSYSLLRYPVSAPTGAKIVLLSNIGEGATKDSEPSSISMMYWSDSTRLAFVLGYVLRGDLTPEFIRECSALDYVELMNPEKGERSEVSI